MSLEDVFADISRFQGDICENIIQTGQNLAEGWGEERVTW